MKETDMKRRGKAAIISALTALLGCATMYQLNAKTYQMVGNAQMPAAKGSVAVKTSANGNTRLRVQVKHLTPPDKLVAGARGFVVWVEPPHERPQNIGALVVDQNLNGELYTLTPQHEFELSITPERSPTAPEPTGPVVLRTAVSIPVN
jgi:anti-sigma-K factor RskA